MTQPLTDEERAIRTTLSCEIERLRVQVKQADARGDEATRRALAAETALDWYADKARALAKDVRSGVHNDAVLASLAALATDGGRRADAAVVKPPHG